MFICLSVAVHRRLSLEPGKVVGLFWPCCHRCQRNTTLACETPFLAQPSTLTLVESENQVPDCLDLFINRTTAESFEGNRTRASGDQNSTEIIHILGLLRMRRLKPTAGNGSSSQMCPEAGYFLLFNRSVSSRFDPLSVRFHFVVSCSSRSLSSSSRSACRRETTFLRATLVTQNFGRK